VYDILLNLIANRHRTCNLYRVTVELRKCPLLKRMTTEAPLMQIYIVYGQYRTDNMIIVISFRSASCMVLSAVTVVKMRL